MEIDQFQLALGYINGIMFTSGAFITATGIIFALGISRNLISKFYSGLLLASILLGAATITTALRWYSAPTDSYRFWATLLLLIQFIIWYLPAGAMLSTIWKREKNAAITKEVDTKSADGTTESEMSIIIANLERIEKAVKTKKRHTYGQGIFIAGIAQIGIFFAMVLSAGYSLGNRAALNDVLDLNGGYTFLSGFILIIIGFALMQDYDSKKKH